MLGEPIILWHDQRGDEVTVTGYHIVFIQAERVDTNNTTTITSVLPARGY